VGVLLGVSQEEIDVGLRLSSVIFPLKTMLAGPASRRFLAPLVRGATYCVALVRARTNVSAL
jgi:hypothetical protein